MGTSRASSESTAKSPTATDLFISADGGTVSEQIGGNQPLSQASKKILPRLSHRNIRQPDTFATHQAKPSHPGALRKRKTPDLRLLAHGRKSLYPRALTKTFYRTGNSRSAAIDALSIFQKIQGIGVMRTLMQLNLEKLKGQGSKILLAGLTDIVCQNCDSIDEPIARDTWLSTILELKEYDVKDFRALSQSQIGEIYLIFIVFTIETLVYEKIATFGMSFFKNLDRGEDIDQQMRDHIEGTVRDSFSCDLSELPNMSVQDITEIIDNAHASALEWLLVWKGFGK